MTEHENGLLAIEIDADDYAEAAAEDTPVVSRTHQSEAAFQAIKANYTAKIDGGNTYKDLIAAVPVLASDHAGQQNGNCMYGADGRPKVKLSKKDVQLLGYAVGELYYDKEYDCILELCVRVRGVCEVDGKTRESLDRWEKRCWERMS